MDRLEEATPPLTLTQEFLARYELQRPLGRGGMGEVHLARQLALDRLVAVKFLRRPDAINLSRFLRESRVLACLQHPGIVTVFDAGIDSATPYLAMEYVDGETLRTLLGRVSVSPVTAMAIGISLAEALQAVHARQIIHRDIKPGNIMVSRSGATKLVDFGLGKPGGGELDLTAPGVVLGSPRYMSPEQLQGLPLTSVTDLYSLGVVVFEVSTGHHPFWSHSRQGVSPAPPDAAPPPMGALRPGVPAALDAVTARAMARRPGDRYRSMQEFADELKRLLPREGVGTTLLERPLSFAWQEGGNGSDPAAAVTAEPCTVTETAGSRPGPAVQQRPEPCRITGRIGARSLGLIGAAALALTGLLLLPGKVPPSRPREPAAETPAVAIESMRFERPDRLLVQLNRRTRSDLELSAIDGARVVSTRRVKAGEENATLEALPAARALVIRLMDRSGQRVMHQRPFRTLRPFAVSNLLCLPTDTELLVDFDLPEDRAIVVEIGPWLGLSRVVHRSQSARGPTVRVVFRGLHAATDYALTVRDTDGWPGLETFRFSTARRHDGRVLAEILARGGRDSMSLDLLSVALQAGLSLRLLPDLARFLVTAPPESLPDPVWHTLRRLRSREICDSLVKAIAGADQRGAAARRTMGEVVAVPAEARDPRTSILAERCLGQLPANSDRELRNTLLEGEGVALSGRRSREACNELARIKERWADAANPVKFARYMVQAHPGAAREQFCRWMARRTPVRWDLWTCGVIGLGLTGHPEDVGALEALLKLPPTTPEVSLTARTLAGFDSARARDSILEALRREPESLELVWATARSRLKESGPVLARVARTASVPRVRRDALFALGLVGATSFAGPVIESLKDPDPAIRGAAAWTTGTLLRKVEPCPQELIDLACSDRDATGTAAWALGELSAAETTGRLREALRVALAEPSPKRHVQIFLLCHVLTEFRDAASRPLLASMTVAGALPYWLRSMASRCIKRLQTGTGNAPRILFPQLPFDGTGLRVSPGEVIRARAEGAWGYPGGLAPVSWEIDAPAIPETRPCCTLLVGLQDEIVRSSGTQMVAQREGEVFLSPWCRPTADPSDPRRDLVIGAAQVWVER